MLLTINVLEMLSAIFVLVVLAFLAGWMFGRAREDALYTQLTTWRKKYTVFRETARAVTDIMGPGEHCYDAGDADWKFRFDCLRALSMADGTTSEDLKDF